MDEGRVSAVDERLVRKRMSVLARMLDAHAGGVELVNTSLDGRLTLRYTGFCTGCPYRPLTSAATLRPMLMSIPGVTGIDIQGGGVSVEAEERIAAQVGHSEAGVGVTPIDVGDESAFVTRS